MDEFVFRKPMFGKDVEIVLYDVDDELAEQIANRSYAEGQRLSRIFSFYDERSELSTLNKDRRMHVSDELLKLLGIAREFYTLTDGRYDVSLGKSIMQRKSGQPETAKCSFEDVIIEGNDVTLKNDDVLIDLGSIAKGYIVDKMVEVLEEEGVLSGLVDGRGDIRIFGDAIQNISIQHPRDKDAIIKSINVTDCGIATSGDYSQYVGSFDKPHIINSMDFSSITVVGPSLAIADAFATALFVSNSLKLIERYKDLKIMTIDKDMNMKYYNGFEELLEESS
jgi:thiamine biosynthesis lipoprotein